MHKKISTSTFLALLSTNCVLLFAYTKFHVTTHLCPTFHNNTNLRSTLHTVVDKSHLACFDFGFLLFFIMCPQLNGFYSNMYLRWLELYAFTFTFGGRILHSIWPPGLERKQLKCLQRYFCMAVVEKAFFLCIEIRRVLINDKSIMSATSVTIHILTAFADYGYCFFFFLSFFFCYPAKMNVIMLPSLPPVLLHAQNVRKLTTSL